MFAALFAAIDKEFVDKEFAHLDILVSNAASGVLKPALELMERHWSWAIYQR